MSQVIIIWAERMYELKDYLKAINESKTPLLDSDDKTWEKKRKDDKRSGWLCRAGIVSAPLFSRTHPPTTPMQNAYHDALINR